MTVSICEAISRTADNGLKINKGYYLFIRTSKQGDVSIQTYPECESEIIYGSLHDFMKDWQSISCRGYANNEDDLQKLFSEILSDSKIEVGDTVEVYCPSISNKKYIEKVNGIEGEWIIFEGTAGKIQSEFCTKQRLV